LAEKYEWRTSDPTVFEIAGRRINLMKRGAEYAEQFGKLTGWIGTHGIGAFFAANEAGIFRGGTSDADIAIRTVSFMLNEGIKPDALIDLGAITLGVEREFVEENFDPGWFVDAIMTLLEERPGIAQAITRVIERFLVAREPSSERGSDKAQN